MLRPSAPLPRLSRLAAVLALPVAAVLATGCGAPPQPHATPGLTGPVPVPTLSATGPPPVSGAPVTPPGGLPTATRPTIPGTGLPGVPGLPPPGGAGLPGVPPPGGAGQPAPVPTASACAGHPSGADVLSLLRKSGVIPSGVRVTTDTGPLCSGEWQFTEFTVPDSDPLQAVTRRREGRLTVVAAGTDVCSADVTGGAPEAIQKLACDADVG